MWKERQTEIDKNVGKKESKKNKTMVTYIRDKEKQTNVWERREGDTKRAKEKETRVWEERERQTKMKETRFWEKERTERKITRMWAEREREKDIRCGETGERKRVRSVRREKSKRQREKTR